MKYILIILSLSMAPLALNAMETHKKQKLDLDSMREVKNVTIRASLLSMHNNRSFCDMEESYWAPPRLGSEEEAISHYNKSNSYDCYTLKFKKIYNDPTNASIQCTYVIQEPSNTNPSEWLITLPYNTGTKIPYVNEYQENNTSAPQKFILRLENTVEFE